MASILDPSGAGVLEAFGEACVKQPDVDVPYWEMFPHGWFSGCKGTDFDKGRRLFLAKMLVEVPDLVFNGQDPRRDDIITPPGEWEEVGQSLYRVPVGLTVEERLDEFLHEGGWTFFGGVPRSDAVLPKVSKRVDPMTAPRTAAALAEALDVTCILDSEFDNWPWYYVINEHKYKNAV